MNFEIGTLRKWVFASVMSGALLLAMFIPAEAQRGRGLHRIYVRPPYGRAVGYNRNRTRPPYGRAYGYYRRNDRRAEHDYRKAVKRDLKRHQRYDRVSLRERLRDERQTYGNNPEFRARRNDERQALRLQQREERGQFKDRFKGNGKGNGKGRP